MDDLISRQAAIYAIKSYWKNEVDRIPKESTDFDVFTQICDSILSHNASICKAIDKLPSVVHPEHGHWIHGREISRDYIGDACVTIHYENWWCSKCNYTVDSILSLNFCPHCGAKMDDRRIKYRKKPIIIEAYQTDVEMDIETLEGVMHASIGDYIITGVNGEQYPCKPDIFEQTYDEVKE